MRREPVRGSLGAGANPSEGAFGCGGRGCCGRSMRIDDRVSWAEIEAAYVTGGMSYREIGEKFGISRSAVGSRGKRGDWVKKRQKFEEDVMERTLEENKEAAVQRLSRLLEVGDQLLCKVEQMTEVTDSPAGLKTLTEALKNIRDAQMLKENKQEGDKLTVVLEGAEGYAA